MEIAEQKEKVKKFIEYINRPFKSDVELFFLDLMSRDWSYTYSDDIEVFRRGRDHIDRLNARLHQLENKMSDRQIALAKKAIMEGQDASSFYVDLTKEVKVVQSPELGTLGIAILTGMTPVEFNSRDRILEDLGNLFELVRVGGNAHETYLVYSPFMVKSKELAEYNSRTDVYMKNRGVAISARAEHAIDQFFTRYRDDRLMRFFTLESLGDNCIDWLRYIYLDSSENATPLIGIMIGNAWVAMAPTATSIQSVVQSLRAQYYRPKNGDENYTSLMKRFYNYSRLLSEMK